MVNKKSLVDSRPKLSNRCRTNSASRDNSKGRGKGRLSAGRRRFTSENDNESEIFEGNKLEEPANQKSPLPSIAANDKDHLYVVVRFTGGKNCDHLLGIVKPVPLSNVVDIDPDTMKVKKLVIIKI